MVIALPNTSWFKCILTGRSIANAYGRRDGALGEQFRDRCHGLRRAGQGGHPVLGKVSPGIHHRAELLHGAGILPFPSGGLRALQGSAAAACPGIVPLSGTEGHPCQCHLAGTNPLQGRSLGALLKDQPGMSGGTATEDSS